MGPMKLFFDVRDIFRAPRLALSGKKILVFTQALLAGYLVYFILTYLAFGLAGYTFADTWSKYGLYPCLIGNPASWFAVTVYWVGVIILFLAISFGCTAVSRITYKQLKGDEFFSSGDAWRYVKKHWHAVVFTPVTFIFILIFFFGLAAVFALLGKIPYLGEFLFVIPYLLYFFGAIFTIYTAVVFGVSFLYTPSIISAYEEDTMGTVFNSYSTTWSQPWRIVLYHLVLLPIGTLSIYVFSWFWIGGFQLINYFFGYEWFMGSKLANIVTYAANIVCPESVCKWVLAFCRLDYGANYCYNTTSTWDIITTKADLASMSGSETAAGVILAVFLFLLILSAAAYVLSILSVGETLMFVIFKKKSDDDNLLERKDEDDIEEDNEDEDDEDISIDDEGDNNKESSDDDSESDSAETGENE